MKIYQKYSKFEDMAYGKFIMDTIKDLTWTIGKYSDKRDFKRIYIFTLTTYLLGKFNEDKF